MVGPSHKNKTLPSPFPFIICWAHQPVAGRSPLLASSHSHSHSRQPPPHLLICPLNRPSFLPSFGFLYCFFPHLFLPFPKRRRKGRGQHVKRPKNGTTLDNNKKWRRRIRKGSNIWEEAAAEKVNNNHDECLGGRRMGKGRRLAPFVMNGERGGWLAICARDSSSILPQISFFPIPIFFPSHLSRFGAKIRVGHVVLVVTKIARDLNQRRHRATK